VIEEIKSSKPKFATNISVDLFDVVALSALKLEKEGEWLVEFGASRHMTRNKSVFA